MLIIVIISVLASVIMVSAILLQNPKSGGAGPMMGGSSQLIGFKRTTDILEKTTWTGITVLFLVCITYSLFQGDIASTPTSENIEKAKTQKIATPKQEADPTKK